MALVPFLDSRANLICMLAEMCIPQIPIMESNFYGIVKKLSAVLPTSTFTEMIRLARDETPFPLAMQPKVTALAW
jgi:hypothetical protein